MLQNHPAMVKLKEGKKKLNETQPAAPVLIFLLILS